MSQDLNAVGDQQPDETPVEQTTVETPVAQPQIEYNPELAELRNQIQQYQSAFQQLSPYADVIQKLVTDPNAPRFVNDALSAYEQLGQRKPEIPDEIKPLYEKVTNITEYIDTMKQREKQAEEAQQAERQSVQTANFNRDYAYAQRLEAQHPEIKEDNYFAIRAMKMYCDQNGGIPLEQAFKRIGSRFVKDVATAPPSSLRADSGEIGVPPAASTASDASMPFRDILVGRLRKDQKGA